MAATPAEYTQARIRVSQRGALVLEAALTAYEVFLLDARDIVGASSEAKRLVNANLKELRRLQEETERTITEHGWDMDDDELQPPREA
jgi:hypothetical protein